MKKLCRFFGIIAFGIIFCAGCGNGQTDVIPNEPLGESVGIRETSREQNVQEQGYDEETDYGNANATAEELQVSTETNTEMNTGTNSNQPDGVSVEGEQSFLSMEERYRAILLNDGKFICTDLQNKELSIEKIKDAVTDDDSITVAVSKFAVADLDGNGEKEIVLWIQINGVSDYGFEVLRYQENAVYGYTLSYRAFMDLKTDGTFIFSGGAADSGIGKLRFPESGYAVDMLYNSETCSEEEFNDAMSRQAEKPNVRWYDLTDGDVNIAFGN